VGEKPLLFVMAEDTKDADSIAERLRREPEFKGKDRVLLIHTKKNGEISTKDLIIARDASRNVDKGTSRIRAIVSVLMLREGWDVRNVSVILGLRPFTAKANILPEQAIGRGLRLMRRIPRHNKQILELIGTNAFENFIRELEKEGVSRETGSNWLYLKIPQATFDDFIRRGNYRQFAALTDWEARRQQGLFK